MTEKFTCPECGQHFKSAQGRGSHRSRTHGIKGVQRPWDQKPGPSTKTQDTPAVYKKPGWTDEETSAFVQEFALERALDPISSAQDIMRTIENRLFPLEKRGKQLTDSLKAAIKAALGDLKEETLVFIKAPPEPPEPPDVEAILEKASLPLLMEVTARKIGQVIEGSANVHKIREWAAQPKPEPAPRKERKVVVGLFGWKPVQAQTLQAGYTGPMELRVLDRDKVPPTVDYVLSSRFLDHAQWERLKLSGLSRDRVVCVSGGVTNALRVLEDMNGRL